MASLRDWYFQQLVTEADLDEAFTLMQDADQNYVIDNGLVGVYFGLDVAEAGVPNLTVQVSAGAAYDQTGQRMAVPSTQLVNVAVDSNAVSTTVAGVGNSKIISVYVKFKRVLGNPKTDGNNASIQYDRDEGYEFIVRQSTEAVGPTPPALQADEILLADITRVFGGTTVVNAAISTARRQWSIDATAGAFSVKTGRVDSAIQAVLDVANNHIVDAVGAHAATAISNTPAGTIAATTVQAAIDELHTDAEAHKADASDAHAASAITNTAAGNIVATTVQTAINELDSEKGGLSLANVWALLNTFSTGFSTAGMLCSGNAQFYAAGGDKYVQYKLLDATAADEETRITEVYATGQPTTIDIGTTTSGYVHRYDVDVLIVRQALYSDAHTVNLQASFSRSGGTSLQLGTTTLTGDHGTTAGTISLALSAHMVQVTLSAPTNDMNIRVAVKVNRVKVAA